MGAEEAGKYQIKNPKSLGHCKAQPLTGGITLEAPHIQESRPPTLPRLEFAPPQEWDIEDKDFYEKEGLNIATRNLWARPGASRHLSCALLSPNLLGSFL